MTGAEEDELFEWDDAKNATNLEKHGVSFEDAKTVFDDPFVLESPDESHSWDEDRWIALGRLTDLRIIVVIYVEREGAIRLISARPATRTERSSYEDRTHP